MNTLRLILKPGLFIIAAILLISAKMSNIPVKVKYTSIDSLTLDGSLKVQIKGLGGHQEECIEFDIKNLTPDTQYVEIEPGRILIPEDTAYQNIFLVKRKNIKLNPFENEKVNGYGFCCKSSNHSPQKGMEFSIGYMAPTEWIKLAEIINKNSFPVSAIQSAVWSLSNDHPISSITADDMTAISLLRNTVAEIKGIEVPWYSITYEKDTAMLFSDRPERIFGEIEYYMKNNGMLTVNIRDKNGRVVTTLVKESVLGPGKYTYDLDVKVKGWPRGEYDIYFYNDYSTINLKKSFKL